MYIHLTTVIRISLYLLSKLNFMIKKFLTLLLISAIVILVPSKAEAQLEDGSIAPDWTLTDINGIEWNLYTLLDEGKSVFLDYSAVWCGPCWSYHTGGNLETLYEDYGPDGTNEVMVFMIEADGFSTMEELTGVGGSTMGDWVTGTPYPIFLTHFGDPSYDAVSDYEIGYFPTIYRVCPNRVIKEIGQVSVTALYNSIADCEIASAAVDPSIMSYTGETVGCSDVELSVNMQNMGFDNLTSCTIKAFEDGTEVLTYDWSGDLALYEMEEVVIGSIVLSSEEAEIDIEITSADDVTENNAVSTTISYEDDISMVIHLEFKTDNYPTQLRWEVIDESTGEQIYEDGPYNNGEKNEVVFDEDITLPGYGCYTFNCFDTGGDGITGSGYFKLFNEDGGLIVQGTENVGYKKAVALKVADETTINVIDAISALSVYPNPVQAELVVDFNLTTTEDINISIVDMLGRRINSVTSSNLTAGDHKYTIDTSTFANGLYFVKMESNGVNQTVKFTVAH